MTKVFFSQLNHKAWEGYGTHEFPDALTGEMLPVNYMGTEVDGYPGYVNEAGEVIRPKNFESYIFRGTLDQGKIYPADMALADDPRSATDRLIRALYDTDIETAKEAICDGADVNRQANSYSPHPIWFSHIKLSDYDVKNLAERNKLWELILGKAKNVAAPTKNCSCLATSFHVFSLRNTEIAASIILVGIRETRGQLAIDLPENFEGLGNVQDSYHPARVGRKKQMLAIHRRVSERLQNPMTILEQEAAAALTDESRALWTQPLQIPDLADLPMPTQQFIDGVKQFIDIGKEMGGLLNNFAGPRWERPLTGAARTVFKMASDDATEISERLDSLRERGLIGIRKPKPRGTKPGQG